MVPGWLNCSPLKGEFPNVVCDTGADDDGASENDRAGAAGAGRAAGVCELCIDCVDFTGIAGAEVGRDGAEAEEEVPGREDGRVAERLARDLEGPRRAATAADLSIELDEVRTEGFDFVREGSVRVSTVLVPARPMSVLNSYFAGT